MKYIGLAWQILLTGAKLPNSHLICTEENCFDDVNLRDERPTTDHDVKMSDGGFQVFL